MWPFWTIFKKYSPKVSEYVTGLNLNFTFLNCRLALQFSHSCVWLCNARLPCPSPTPRACSNSCPSSRWCHPTISSSVVSFSSCLQSFPASGSFPVSQLFASGGQSIGASASASVLPMNIQDWFPLGFSKISFTTGLLIGANSLQKLLECFLNYIPHFGLI